MSRSLAVACTALLLGPAVAEPPREMPEELKVRYTMGGKAEVDKYYVDDTGPGGDGTHYRYGEKEVQNFVDAAERLRATGVDVDTANKRLWIIEALRQHPLRPGAQVAVYGSMEPWYEGVAIAHGAGQVVTIEYNKLDLGHPKTKTMTVAECAERPADCRGFDYAFSMSSFDHDGLGRYGDPLNPDGDLHAMQTALSQLKHGGLLFLSVPIGPDLVVWNLHRRYGRYRLKRLLEGWDVIARIGWDIARLHAPADHRSTYEPIFVLRRPFPGTQPTDYTKKESVKKKKKSRVREAEDEEEEL